MNQTGAKKSSREVIAAGARVAIRDAEWLVRKVDRTSHGSLAVSGLFRKNKINF